MRYTSSPTGDLRYGERERERERASKPAIPNKKRPIVQPSDRLLENKY
jgi:hypothetical protein